LSASLTNLGRLDDRLIDKENGDFVADRVDAMALGALQALAAVLELQRLLARRANQNFEEILRDHNEVILREQNILIHSVKLTLPVAPSRFSTL